MALYPAISAGSCHWEPLGCELRCSKDAGFRCGFQLRIDRHIHTLGSVCGIHLLAAAPPSLAIKSQSGISRGNFRCLAMLHTNMPWLEVEAQLHSLGPRCDVVRAAEGREEVIQRRFVGQVDDREA